MPRWLERRGFTLHPPPGHEAEQFVRLSLMERAGLVAGWFNVREARAEQDPQHHEFRVVAGGRALSWRWLREREAAELLDERLGTLEAMGYTVVGSVMGTRGRWDWLYDLVHKRLAAPADPVELGDATDSAPDALRDALSRLGLTADAVLEGVAAVLGLSVSALQEPNARTARDADPDQVAILLPFLVHHERPEIREVGERWLACPAVTYQLAPPTLMQWLESDVRVGALLSPRLAREGPALLGPERLVQLSRTAPEPVRTAARKWAQRLR